jgi:hypothetical protein
MKRTTWLLALAPLTLASALPAQQRAGTPATAVRPEMLRTAENGFGVPVAAAAGTRFSRQQAWLGTTCVGPGGGCLVAQGSGGGATGLEVQLGSRARSARAGLLLGHGQAHTLTVSLDGREVMGFSCNGRSIRLRAPGGRAFRWTLFDGEKVLRSGQSAGEAVEVASPPHGSGGAMPMQLSVQHRDPAQLAGASDAWCKKYGCLQLVLAHGDHRIMVMPVLERSTPMELRTLGVRVAGVPSFAVSSLEVGR